MTIQCLDEPLYIGLSRYDPNYKPTKCPTKQGDYYPNEVTKEELYKLAYSQQRRTPLLLFARYYTRRVLPVVSFHFHY